MTKDYARQKFPRNPKSISTAKTPRKTPSGHRILELRSEITWRLGVLAVQFL
jgi:hypothetical protein